ncbi:MAG TPA: hypothetical protein VGN95_25430 [Pyrinomonadaceae bacterium]|nr:hypothetical protein [Pyrinomonadaceae bacterium]
MSNRFIGLIGVLWGGGLLLFKLLSGGQAQGNGAYTAGQGMGWVFGLALFLVGIYYLVRSPQKSPK